VITTTPLPGQVAALPTGLVETQPAGTLAPLPTLDATALGGALQASSPLQGTATALPQNCILHVIKEGDTPFGVALQYNADPFALLEINNLNDERARGLQIGDVLIVPLEGCPLTAADVSAATATPTAAAVETALDATAEVTADVSPTASVAPTITLPPTAASAQVVIVEVLGAGDVTAEGVVIRNQGSTINLKDWRLSDDRGNVYTFAERLLFSNGQVTLYTRVGTDTAVALFWNKSAALFAQPGAVLTLRDAAGVVQSSFRVPAPVSLP
jgi:hypothetical protein